MAERFSQLYKLQDNLYISGAPIIISAGSLLMDTETDNVIAQLKFHSISNKIIKAIKISLSAYDISENDLQAVENYQYLDLHITNGQYFGQNKAIVFPEKITRSFAIKNISVIFLDKTYWNWDSSVKMDVLPTQQRLSSYLNNSELEKQYSIITNGQAEYVPSYYSDLWFCTCGEANNGAKCTKCALPKKIIFDSFDISSLQTQANERIAIETELQKEIDAKQTKYKKIACLIFSISLTIFSGLFIACGSIPNLISDGLTIRVFNLILWTICAFVLGVIMLLEQHKAKQGRKMQFKFIKSILIAVGLITFVVFYIMTYIM